MPDLPDAIFLDEIAAVFFEEQHGLKVLRQTEAVAGRRSVSSVIAAVFLADAQYELGKSEEARKVLQRVAKVNGTTADIPALQPEKQERKSILALFNGGLRRRSLSLFLAWALISIAYYGVFVYLPVKLSSEGFAFMRGQVFLVVLALVQLPGFALSAYGVERWGRKPTLIGFLLLSAVGCMFYSLGSSPFVVIGSTLLMSFSLLGTWGALYAFTPEVYPTDLRASGMGMAGAVARAKAGAGPLWPRFAELNTNRPIFGDRDGELYYDVHQVSFERRQGYAWYTERPAQTLQLYQRWRLMALQSKDDISDLAR